MVPFWTASFCLKKIAWFYCVPTEKIENPTSLVQKVRTKSSFFLHHSTCTYRFPQTIKILYCFLPFLNIHKFMIFLDAIIVLTSQRNCDLTRQIWINISSNIKLFLSWSENNLTRRNYIFQTLKCISVEKGKKIVTTRNKILNKQNWGAVIVGSLTINEFYANFLKRWVWT